MVGQIIGDTVRFAVRLAVESLVKPAICLFFGASVGAFVGDYV